MMEQYRAIKNENKDAFLFYRLGDFYEMFFEDAENASKLLGLTLTGRDCGQEERAPMCGVPYHSAESYINRLIKMGFKVAICEQTEDPALAKGLVRREIVRKVTPGTVVSDEALEGSVSNYIAAVYAAGRRAGICYADVSAGTLRATDVEGDDLAEAVNDELSSVKPTEAVLFGPEAFCRRVKAYLAERRAFVTVRETEMTAAEAGEVLNAQLGESFDPARAEAHSAAAVLISYLRETLMNDVPILRTLEYYRVSRYTELPVRTRQALELTETMLSRSKQGTLLSVLDRTRTSMGGRTLRNWLEQPLRVLPEILRRQNGVSELFSDAVLRGDLGEAMTGIFDLERLMGQIAYGSANARTLWNLARTAERVPGIKKLLAGLRSEELKDVNAAVCDLEDLREKLTAALDGEHLPISVREGGMIREGYSPELDELRRLSGDSRGVVAAIEARERERLGFKGVRTGYNRVFGYYIEVSRQYTGEVPPEYVRKQTVSNCERYVTPELKELESRILQADSQSKELEYRLFCDLREAVRARTEDVLRTAAAIGRLDALCSLAETAAAENYVRPEVNLSGAIDIRNGRHPVVEKMVSDTVFVPNDTHLDKGDNRLAIITGPNMAGKSTYMRQVAQIVILAQIGSFVPASSASVGIVDKIFTRIGSSDELSAGRSTFMVEMSETARILHEATPDSLIIFDEIGRGTSTFDGMAIARAVVEYAAGKSTLGAKTLFATHYHELTALENEIQGVKNYCITAKKRGDDVIFLRKVVPGAAEMSFGIEVGRLAGLPPKVISRAKTVLKELESGRETVRVPAAAAGAPADGQLSLTEDRGTEILAELASLKTDTISPIEALNILYRLSKSAGEII
ncbi:MAG: DNA mismatch repair protein MutS [Oscillospiraceae bacterium]|nr:DNA mismatch repair protein MutS [Oscillospiraceae bacterium]